MLVLCTESILTLICQTKILSMGLSKTDIDSGHHISNIADDDIEHTCAFKLSHVCYTKQSIQENLNVVL